MAESVTVALNPLRRHSALNESGVAQDDLVEDVENSLSTLTARVNS